MLRWVISPVIGNGQHVRPTELNETNGPYRPYAMKYAPDAWMCVSNTSWSLMLVKADDFTDAEADTRIIVMPLRELTHDLTAGERQWLADELQRLGLPFAWLQNPQTVRQALLTMAHWVEPTFDTDWFKTI